MRDALTFEGYSDHYRLRAVPSRAPFTVMGPCYQGRGRSRGAGGRGCGGFSNADRRDTIRTMRVGEVPMFSDRTDPKVYRRHLFDWILFQDLSDDTSSKKFSLGQRVFAILMNIQGSAGHRLGHIAGMVYAGMTKE